MIQCRPPSTLAAKVDGSSLVQDELFYLHGTESPIERCEKGQISRSIKCSEYGRWAGGVRKGTEWAYNPRLSHVLVHEFMRIYYALVGWSGNRERRDERTKRKREKDKVRSRSKIPISSKPAVRNFVPKTKIALIAIQMVGIKKLN
ncbi:hypothetical protein EVAR_65693_1 [Eumeta japonica]|uniref:Uncharacterized protein n=1 Tax=Eumeta variegata TaxID=151549 RepID=A0A4C1Z9U7_EUMVA|nr:hypothetical protein EVAR_65693_1 [Eumeta japonica]